jgi:hypothetical protein
MADPPSVYVEFPASILDLSHARVILLHAPRGSPDHDKNDPWAPSGGVASGSEVSKGPAKDASGA